VYHSLANEGGNTHTLTLRVTVYFGATPNDQTKKSGSKYPTIADVLKEFMEC
jgi:hypothetical protein